MSSKESSSPGDHADLFGVINRPLTAAVLYVLVFSRRLWCEGKLTLTRDHLVVVGLCDVDDVCVNPSALPERARRDGIWTLVRGIALVSSSTSVSRLQHCLETSEEIRKKL